MAEQIALSRWIGRASPFTCFALAATELADAGIMEKTRLMEQLRVYQVDLCEYACDEWLARHELEMANQGKSPGPWDKTRVKAVPQFYYVPAAAGEYARVAAVDGGILAGMAFVFFMLSFAAFLRYDVR
jgi:hypothetical protein